MSPATFGTDVGKDRRRAACAVGILAAIAAGIALALSLTVFDHFSSNHDEPVYVFQAQVLRAGDLSIPAEGTDPFFRPWLYAERDGRLFSVFPPVWPALLALSDLLTGSDRAILMLDAAAAVVLVYLFTFELLGDRRRAVAAAGLVAVSPFLLVLAGTRLSYPMALNLALGFGWSLLRGVRTKRFGWLVLAGAFWGVDAFARPLDALMFGTVAAVALLIVHLRGREGGLGAPLAALGRIAAGVAVGAAPPLLVGALYNNALTGSPLRFPLAAAGGSNDYGFGLRQLADGSPIVDFGPDDAFRALYHNLGVLPAWTPGGYLMVALAVAGVVLLVREGQRGSAALLVGVAAIVPIGNFPYWGNVFVIYGKRIIGPHYYLTMLVPLMILTGVALLALAHRSPRAFAGLALLMLVATGLEVRPKLEINRNIACTNKQPLLEVDRTLAVDAGSGDVEPGGSIVLVPASFDAPAIFHPLPELGNPPDLRSRRLYATTLGPRTFELAARYPDRAFYRLSFRVPEDGNRARRVPVVDRIRQSSGSTIRIPFEVDSPGRRGQARAYVTDGVHNLEVVLDEDSAPGRRYRGAWLLGPDGVVADMGDLPAGSPPGAPARWWGDAPHTLIVGVSFGPRGPESERWETHFWADGDADGVTLFTPGDALHGLPASVPGKPVPDDVAKVWRVTGEIGNGRRFPLRDPCTT